MLPPYQDILKNIFCSLSSLSAGVEKFVFYQPQESKCYSENPAFNQALCVIISVSHLCLPWAFSAVNLGVWMKTVKKMGARIMPGYPSFHLEIPGCLLPTQIFPISRSVPVPLTGSCGSHLCLPPRKLWRTWCMALKPHVRGGREGRTVWRSRSSSFCYYCCCDTVVKLWLTCNIV